jgi:hypothetical protein
MDRLGCRSGSIYAMLARMRRRPLARVRLAAAVLVAFHAVLVFAPPGRAQTESAGVVREGAADARTEADRRMSVQPDAGSIPSLPGSSGPSLPPDWETLPSPPTFTQPGLPMGQDSPVVDRPGPTPSPGPTSPAVTDGTGSSPPAPDPGPSEVPAPAPDAPATSGPASTSGPPVTPEPGPLVDRSPAGSPSSPIVRPAGTPGVADGSPVTRAPAGGPAPLGDTIPRSTPTLVVPGGATADVRPASESREGPERADGTRFHPPDDWGRWLRLEIGAMSLVVAFALATQTVLRRRRAGSTVYAPGRSLLATGPEVGVVRPVGDAKWRL